MSTPTPTDPPAPAPDPQPGPPTPAPPAPPTPPEPKDWEAEAAKWKALSRENETRAKANADAARRLAELEEAQKSDAEKLADRLKAAEDRATTAVQQAVAAKIEALATGRFADPQDAVDALGADFLTDTGTVDAAAIETALAALLERKPHWKADPGPRTPRPDPSQGPRPGGTVDIDTQIREAQAKGDWRTALRLQNSKLASLPTPK
ncbi:hypothetical protein ACFVFS_05630 [Kitasatospora sp. NPDC057692]|uniref:hypothetical protein n=1 Tax=Kitasatospora sp. NPDC057692 TaxID=3346215 RepID=UPI00367AEA60